jgi:hypothetical protein
VRPAGLVVAAALAAAPAFAQELGPGVAEVQACVEKNLTARSVEQSLVLETRDAAGRCLGAAVPRHLNRVLAARLVRTSEALRGGAS